MVEESSEKRIRYRIRETRHGIFDTRRVELCAHARSSLLGTPSKSTDRRAQMRSRNSLAPLFVMSTPSTRTNILVVDDDPAMGHVLVEGLSGDGRIVAAVTTPEAALEALAKDVDEVDLIITDLRMPGSIDGLELCRLVASRAPDVPVIVLTGFGDLEAAVAAIRVGAYDFLAKPVKLDVLDIAVRRALDHRSLRRQVKRLSRAVQREARFEELIGSSSALERVRTLLNRIADSSSSVLITGESGTGKELVAHALHASSARAAGPFVAINCAAMPEALLESELFGYERGAFTDAKATHTGMFVEASGGTLFLDEIGELPMTLQPKLLRALQERVVRPLGGHREVPFDARVVAATNRDLELAVEEGRFREDLFFRLNVIELPLPPLRERGNDVLTLAQHFLVRFAVRADKKVVGLTEAVARRLLEYDWPGNVRELHNAMERAIALTTHDHITLDDLPEKVLVAKTSRAPIPLDLGELVTLEEMERRYILHVLACSNGSRTLAARTLGLDRTTLWRRLERATHGDRSSSVPSAEGPSSARGSKRR